VLRAERSLFAVGLIALVGLGGCASQPPAGLGPAPVGAPGTAEARDAPERYRDRHVRWGGEILALRNLADRTEVEIFERPLGDDARPQAGGSDGLRFIAVVAGFLDPAEYRVGDRITVLGRLDGVVDGAVGDYPYRYPRVRATQYHRWPPADPDPGWRYRHDPFYDPWWPWGYPGPYRRWPYGW
jgi:outer membrane lipoprotein